MYDETLNLLSLEQENKLSNEERERLFVIEDVVNGLLEELNIADKVNMLEKYGFNIKFRIKEGN